MPNIIIISIGHAKTFLAAKKTAHILIRQRIRQLGFTPCQIGLSREQLDGSLDLALLQAELREGSHRRFTFGVNPQSLVAASFGGADVLFPLEER